jgi:hypothetical protein
VNHLVMMLLSFIIHSMTMCNILETWTWWNFEHYFSHEYTAKDKLFSPIHNSRSMNLCFPDLSPSWFYTPDNMYFLCYAKWHLISHQFHSAIEMIFFSYVYFICYMGKIHTIIQICLLYESSKICQEFIRIKCTLSRSSY